MDRSAGPTIQTGRIICSALFGSVAIVWAFALLLEGLGRVPLEPGFPLDAPVMTIAALVVGVAAFAGALGFRSRALASVTSFPGGNAELQSPESLSDVQANLIIAWALLEGFALFAAVFYMVTAVASLLVITAAVVVPGFALTFPRTEWYGQAQGASGVRS